MEESKKMEFRSLDVLVVLCATYPDHPKRSSDYRHVNSKHILDL